MTREYSCKRVEVGFKKYATHILADKATLSVVCCTKETVSDKQSRYHFSTKREQAYYLKNVETGEKFTDLEINWKYKGPKNFVRDGYKWVKDGYKWILRVAEEKATLERVVA